MYGNKYKCSHYIGYLTKKVSNCLIILLLVAVSQIGLAASFSPGALYQVCFTPRQNCTQVIIGEIANAKKQILVQMYTFTSMPIAQSLVAAKRRGVDVRIILDKSQVCSKYSPIDLFTKHGISVRIDKVKGIAHNKLMVIDGSTTIGGSFNYTHNANINNAENVLIIKDPEFSKNYIHNWRSRVGYTDGVKTPRCIKKREF